MLLCGLVWCSQVAVLYVCVWLQGGFVTKPDLFIKVRWISPLSCFVTFSSDLDVRGVSKQQTNEDQQSYRNIITACLVLALKLIWVLIIWVEMCSYHSIITVPLVVLLLMYTCLYLIKLIWGDWKTGCVSFSRECLCLCFHVEIQLVVFSSSVLPIDQYLY